MFVDLSRGTLIGPNVKTALHTDGHLSLLTTHSLRPECAASEYLWLYACRGSSRGSCSLSGVRCGSGVTETLSISLHTLLFQLRHIGWGWEGGVGSGWSNQE